MRKTLQLLLLLVFLVAAEDRNLQTIYGAIVIGSGSSGIGASAALASKNINHIILQARNRFGGRTYATTVSGVNVDLGASFVHNPQSNNSVNAYVANLNWTKTLANFSNADVMYTGSAVGNSASAKIIKKNFTEYASTIVNATTDYSIEEAWTKFKDYQIANSITSTNDDLRKAYFEIYLQGNLNGADMNTVSTRAYVSISGKSTYDYLPGTSYAALIQAIYNAYCKNATIIYNQQVTNIDYSGTVVKVTTSSGQIYYANKVINTIPLGVLQSGSVTFTPALPTEYQTAISSIGMGIFNKIIVTLSGNLTNNASMRVLDFFFPNTSTNSTPFPQCYIAPSNPNLLLFFVSGNTSATLNNKTDTQIISELQTYLNQYIEPDVTVTNYTITRWEQEAFSKGSYSYYKVGTTSDHYKTLSTSISSKLWFAGEHTHPNQSSNVHGAFQTGLWAGAAAASALSGLWQVVSALGLLFLVLLG